MRLGVIAFALGVCLLQWRAALPGGAMMCMLAAASALLLVLTHRLVPKSGVALARTVAAACALGMIGFLWAALLAHLRLADRLDPAWEGREIEVEGVIAGLPQPLERGVRFEFQVESVVPAQAAIPRRLLLVWQNGLTREEFQEVVPVRAGERWRLPVRLRRPHGQSNPHGFDYEAWLLEQGVRATGNVRSGAGVRGVERLDAFVLSPGYLIEHLRERVREHFWDALPEHRYAGVLAALAIGDQRAIEPQEWEIFTRTGVNHLMSISGLHVTMVSGLLAWMIFVAWSRIPALALHLPAQKAAALGGFAAALAYCLISGFAVPAQRTLYMVGAVALALLCDRMSSPSRVLAVALALVLLLDPWAVLSPGFWLSFGAVALIFYVAYGRVRRPHWVAQWGAMQWAVTVGLAPLLLVLFQQVSLASPIANALAIPLVSMLVTPLALTGAVVPFDFPLQLAHLLLEWLMWFLRWLSGLEGAVWQQHAPRAWTIPLALVGIAWMLLPRGFPSRWTGALLFLPMAGVMPETPYHGAFELTVFDVGQGNAVLVRTQFHALLYDAGPVWSADSDSGNRVIVPALRGLAVRRLDALVISHDDTDHSGGALSVLRAVPAARLHSSLPAMDPISQAVPFRIPCADGHSWDWDGVRFEFLYPFNSSYDDPGISANNLSCVLRVSGPHGAVLLTGDLEWRGERELLARRARELLSPVIVVPHHGSGTSSTPEFVRAVAPRLAVFSMGYRNRFGHPQPGVVARYAEAGARIVRTDESGAIAIRVDASGIAVRGQRETALRYWYGH